MDLRRLLIGDCVIRMRRRNGTPCARARITKSARPRSWTCDPFSIFSRYMKPCANGKIAASGSSFRYSQVTYLCGFRCKSACACCWHPVWFVWSASTIVRWHFPMKKSRRCEVCWCADCTPSHIRTSALAGRMRITRGALEGLEGVLIRKKGRVRLVLSIDLIRQSAMIEVDSADVGVI